MKVHCFPSPGTAPVFVPCYHPGMSKSPWTWSSPWQKFIGNCATVSLHPFPRNAQLPGFQPWAGLGQACWPFGHSTEHLLRQQFGSPRQQREIFAVYSAPWAPSVGHGPGTRAEIRLSSLNLRHLGRSADSEAADNAPSEGTELLEGITHFFQP